MKGVVLILLTFLAACNSNKSTDAVLAEVWDRDQSIRYQMIELTKAVTVDGRTELVDSLIATSEAVNLIDAKYNPEISIEQLNTMRSEDRN